MNWITIKSEKALRAASAVLLIFIGCAMAYGVRSLSQLNSHYSMKQFMPASHPLYESDREIRRVFRLSEEEPIIVNLQLSPASSGTWLEPDRVAMLERASTLIFGLDSIKKVVSIANVEVAGNSSQGIQVDKILSLVPPKEWSKRILHDPLLTPGLLSVDGRIATLMVDIHDRSELALKNTLQQIRADLAKLSAASGATVSVSGIATLQNDMANLVSKEMQRFLLLAFLACFITLVAYFRSISTVIVCLVLVAIANIATLSCLALSGIPFSILSSTLPILSSIEALAIGSHTLLIFGDNWRQSQLLAEPPSKAKVIWDTYRSLLFPNILMSATTTIGFGTLVLSQVPLIRQFSQSVCLGILVSCFWMSLALPPLMMLFPAPVARRWTASKARWALWVIHYRRFVVFGSFAVLAFFLLKGVHLNWDVKLYDDLPKIGGIRNSAELIDRDLGGMIPLEAMVRLEGEEPWHDPTNIERMKAVLAQWRSNSAVGSAIGLPDLLTTSIQKTNSRQAIAEMLFLYGFSGADNPSTNFLSTEGSSTRVLFRMKDVPAERMDATVKEIEQSLKAAFPKSEVKLGGMATMAHPMNAELSSDLIFGLWQSLVLISILLLFVFRSPRLAMVAALPNLLPPFALLATMAYLKTPVKPVVAIIFSIALGLAYNNTVFLLSRMRRLQQRFGQAAEVITRTWYQESNPCLFSSLAVFGGFAVFLSSYFSPNRTFGAYMLWSIGVGLVGDLVLFPALVSMFPWLLFSSPKSLIGLASEGPSVWRKSLLWVVAAGGLLWGSTATANSMAGSAVVKSPFFLQLPETEFATLLFDGVVVNALKGQREATLPDFSETAPIALQVSGIHLKINFAFKPVAAAQESRGWSFRSKEIEATLVVDRIVAHEEREVNENGSVIVIRLDGSCNDVRLRLPRGATDAKGNLALANGQNGPRIVLDKFSANWKPGSWKIESMHCTGPDGFGEVVAQAVKERLQLIEPYLPAMRLAIQEQLDSGLRGPILFDLENPLQASQRMRLKAVSWESQGRGDVVVRGDAQFHFSKNNGDCSAAIPNFESAPSLESGDAAALFPFSTVNALLSCLHTNQSLTTSIGSDRVPSFQKLQKSWFEKNAVWPDLNHFRNSDVFQFDVTTTAAPVFADAIEVAPNEMSAWYTQAFRVAMFAPQNRELVPYQNIYGNFFSPVNLSFRDGVLAMRTSGEPTLQLQGEFIPEYTQKYQTDTRVDWLRIAAALVPEIQAGEFRLKVPAVQLSPAISLLPKEGGVRGSNYRIAFHLKLAP